MSERRRNTSFYVETLLMIAVFIAIILVLTQVFGLARRESDSARALSDAVVLAGNAAERLSLSDSPDALMALTDEGSAEQKKNVITARYDRALRPDPAGVYTVETVWQPEGELARGVITVTLRGKAEPVYQLETAVYLGEGAK